MKTKNSFALFALFAIILFALTGCQLARADAGGDYYEDRLIGVFITTEHLDLFDTERYLNDKLKGFTGGNIMIDGDDKEYQGRVYANPATDYTFENITGIRYFSPILEDDNGKFTTSIFDDSISDSHISVHSGDNFESRTLTGTLYTAPKSANTYYLNPVYQTEDGSVYLTTGSGISASGVHDEGPMMSQTLEATYAFTENGVTTTDSFSITLAVETMFAPQKIAVLQMNAEGDSILRKEYAPGEMPDALELDPQTAFLIVETHKLDNDGNTKISREIYDSENPNIETFYANTNGICAKRYTQIEWPKGQPDA